tara:strand:- start:5205 stop:5438 length:234 start_codon:yes stop_codon:yes gene_type:complete
LKQIFLKKAFSADKAREDTPIKPTFFIDIPLELIGEKIKEKNGAIYQPKSWRLEGRQVCDGCDCEGNIFQLRIGADA